MMCRGDACTITTTHMHRRTNASDATRGGVDGTRGRLARRVVVVVVVVVVASTNNIVGKGSSGRTVVGTENSHNTGRCNMDIAVKEIIVRSAPFTDATICSCRRRGVG